MRSPREHRAGFVRSELDVDVGHRRRADSDRTIAQRDRCHSEDAAHVVGLEDDEVGVDIAGGTAGSSQIPFNCHRHEMLPTVRDRVQDHDLRQGKRDL